MNWREHPLLALTGVVLIIFVLVFRFTLFWERSILINKEARARRIKIMEEVEARGGEAGAASPPEAARREPVFASAMWGLRTGTALRDDPGAGADACAANGERV